MTWFLKILEDISYGVLIKDLEKLTFSLEKTYIKAYWKPYKGFLEKTKTKIQNIKDNSSHPMVVEKAWCIVHVWFHGKQEKN
jgi:hypothetical protein